MKTYTTLPADVILSALEKLEAYISPTYGPAGRGILVDANGYQKMLDDGYLAIDEFELPDPLENAVIKYVKAASFQANKRAGDGTTTATLLMIAIVRECLKSDKKREFILEDLSVGVAEAIGTIYQSRRLITEEHDLLNIAFNAYHDGDMADIIAKVVKEIGPDGVINVEGGESLDTITTITNGMSIPRGFISPYLSNDAGKVVIENPYVLITTRRIQTNREIMPLLEQLVKQGKRQLLIVCEDMQGEALTTLIMNHQRGNLSVSVVKAPYADEAKKEFLEDLATVTGAEIMDDTTGNALESATTIDRLGRASKVIVTKDVTTILGGDGDELEVESRVKSVREKLAEQPNNDAIQTRLARLTGGIALIKVGASTEAEITTKRAKVDDAVHATQLAYKTGVVAGGARAFQVETSSEELNRALGFPRTVLVANGSHYIDEDAEDAFGVVQAAIESAASIATLLLNCGGIITNGNTNTNTK